MLIETEGGKDHVRQFVKGSPFFQDQNVVKDLRMEEVQLNSKKSFENLASEFLIRA